MIKIQIGSTEMPLDRIDSRWIEEQIRNRRNLGQPVCVRVSIDESGVNFSLATPDCGGTGGSVREWTNLEKRIIDLWGKHGLNRNNVEPGNVISFLAQLKSVL